MAFTFSLPFCILLPDGDYKVKIAENDYVTLRLTKKIPDSYDERLAYRGLTISDLKGYEKVGALNIDNDFKGIRARTFSTDEILSTKESLLIQYFENDGRKTSPNDALVINLEIPNDSFGRFRYTKVTVISENESDLIERALTAINKLISKYRLYTAHFWVTPIHKKDIEVYEKDGVRQSTGPLIVLRSDVSDKIVAEIKKDITTDNDDLTSFLLFLDAKNAYHSMNYPLAIIYSVTAIESLVKTYLEHYAATHEIEGISKEKLLDMSVYYAVTVVLRLIIPKTELPDDLIKDFTAINKLRNEVIHQAKQSVSQEDAQKAIKVAESFKRILRTKIITLLQELMESLEKDPQMKDVQT